MPFAPKSNVEVLNTWGMDDTILAKRTRTLRSGKPGTTRYTLEIRSEPILVNFDDRMLGAGPANAIRDELSNQIKGITEQASTTTQFARHTAAKAFDAGADWAIARYSGGKTGPKRPNPSNTTLFNDSGRLADGLAVQQNRTDSTYTVNVPKNRLDPSSFSTGQAFSAMVDKLVQLVPALRSPQSLVESRPVENAIRAGINDLIAVASSIEAAKLKKLAMERKAFLVAAGRAVGAGARSFIRP